MDLDLSKFGTNEIALKEYLQTLNIWDLEKLQRLYAFEKEKEGPNQENYVIIHAVISVVISEKKQ